MKEINSNKGENQTIKILKQKSIKTNIQTNTKNQTELWLAYGRVSSIQQVTD
jgi:hypothetical protein